MLKLIKYEFRKQLFTKFIMLAVIGAAELFFIYAVLVKNQGKTAVATMLLVFAVIAIVTFVAFESILVYSRDLKTKQSYMLFLVPKSSYSIVGAKIITAFLQLSIICTIFILLAAFDFTFLTVKSGEFKSAVEAINYLLTDILGVNVQGDIIASYFILLVLDWFLMIIIALLSITLSTTILSNSKLKGIVSIAIFVGMIYLSNKLIGLVLPDVLEWSLSYLLFSYMCILCISFIAYIATAWMIEKKVSV